MPVAIVTGASKGLGRALSKELVTGGWSVVIDARHADELAAAARDLPGTVAVVGDLTDAGHRHDLIEAARQLGGLDLVVNNASTLGDTPLRNVLESSPEGLRATFEVNVVAPMALISAAMPLLRASPAPVVVNVSSDAAVEHYETWGGYGSSKSALDHLSATLAAEAPDVRVLAVDPGDMRTEMHQAAFPGEDISDRPLPDLVAPVLVSLIQSLAPSGRFKLAELALDSATTAGL